jgi:hypothetical protein
MEGGMLNFILNAQTELIKKTFDKSLGWSFKSGHAILKVAIPQ